MTYIPEKLRQEVAAGGCIDWLCTSDTSTNERRRLAQEMKEKHVGAEN